MKRRTLVATLLALTALPASAQNFCLDWPIGDVSGGQMVPGHNIRIQQNFENTTHPTFGPRAHAGVDLQYTVGSSANRPVYAAAGGTVRYTVASGYPGGVVVIEHSTPSGPLYTQYGHLGTVLVTNNQQVGVGTQIGTILDQASNSHLHFEVRNWLQHPNGTYYGPGYSAAGSTATAEGWRDPVAEIYTRREPFPGVTVWNTTRNVRSGPSVGYAQVGTVAAGAQPSTEAVSADAAGQGYWWHRIKYDGVNLGWASSFAKGGYGSDVYAGEKQRSCGGSNANITAATVPSSLSPGQTYQVAITVQNTGTTTWTAANSFRLAAESTDGFRWSAFQCGGYSNRPGDSRAYLCSTVAPGASHTFRFNVTGPTGAFSATVPLKVRMVQDGVNFFGGTGTYNVNVVGGSCACSQGISYWGQSVPAGDTFCGFKVCGTSNQLWNCAAGGWQNTGQTSCNCQCQGGFDYLGKAIDPDYTYCGFRVCGMSYRMYECRAGGWTDLGTTCP